MRGPRAGWPFLRFLVGAILIVILLDLLGINLAALGIITLGSSGESSGVRKVTVVKSDAEQTIAAIPIDGLITGDSTTQLDQYLTAAEDDKDVKAVVLEIDTPGGEASAADAMYHRLQKFKADEKASGQSVPVIAAMGGLATSGGYYVACGADYIFAEPTTWTADIGVLIPRFNVSEFLARYGVKETTIVSTGADYKNLGSMFQPEDPKAQAYLQSLADSAFDRFKQVVSEGRHGKLPADTTDIFNGKVYTADEALKLGLIDKIGYQNDAYDYARTAANVSAARVERYQPPTTLERLLGADSLSNIFGAKAQAARGDVIIDGVSVDLRRLADLIAPRPMYLWRGN